MMAGPDTKHRIEFLDGLRGLAILLVVLWHYFGPPDALFLGVPSGFSSNIVVWNGWVGVQMFFLISGFVIFMSLERCRSFLQFIVKRWIRLFPTMLIATIAISAFLILTRLPATSPFALRNIVPGLIFIDPAILHAIFHIPIASLDGPFWSLYAEVAFYIVAGILFFRVGWKPTVAVLIGAAIFATYGRPVLMAMHVPSHALRALEPLDWMYVHMWGWFASGALFWKASELRNPRYFVLATLVGLAAALMSKQGSSVVNTAALVLVVLTFAAAQKSTAVQRLLATRPFAFLGYISYPLYLVHQNIGLALIRRTEMQWPGAPGFLVVAPGFAAVLLLAWAITAIVEPPLKALIRGIVERHSPTTAAPQSGMRPIVGGSLPLETEAVVFRD